MVCDTYVSERLIKFHIVLITLNLNSAIMRDYHDVRIQNFNFETENFQR